MSSYRDLSCLYKCYF